MQPWMKFTQLEVNKAHVTQNRRWTQKWVSLFTLVKVLELQMSLRLFHGLTAGSGNKLCDAFLL